MPQIITNTHDALLQVAIDATGEDRWDALLVLADLCEEQGDEVAAGWREMVALRRWPEINTVACYSWFDASEFGDFDGSDLPAGVFFRLKEYREQGEGWVDYEDTEEATFDVIMLRDAAQAFAAWIREGRP